MLDPVQSCVQRLCRVARLDRDGLLEDDRAGVDPLVDEVDGDARLRDARGKRLLDRVHSREGREE